MTANEGIVKLINVYNVNRIQFINDPNNTLFINNFINRIYIINLETDRLRRNYIIKVMEKYRINFELIIVPRLEQEQYNIIGNNKIKIGEAGCYLSHMFCLNDAITNNYDNIIIFEDDIILHKDFHNIFKKYMTENVLDIFMLGASDFHFRQTNSKLLNIEKSIYNPDSNTKFLCGTYAIFYSKAGYNQMFNARLEYPTFMDDNLIQFLGDFKNTFYISYPSLVAADVSSTNIEHDFWITNILRDKYYYKNCFDNQFDFSEYNFIYLGLLVDCIIDINLSYRDNILETLNIFFKTDFEKINNIKNRLEYNFFTIDDLKFIIDGK
jgi:GR25 family glycosyltransferase involved in LPS biosynthesis